MTDTSSRYGDRARITSGSPARTDSSVAKTAVVRSKVGEWSASAKDPAKSAVPIDPADETDRPTRSPIAVALTALEPTRKKPRRE